MLTDTQKSYLYDKILEVYAKGDSIQDEYDLHCNLDRWKKELETKKQILMVEHSETSERECVKNIPRLSISKSYTDEEKNEMRMV